MRSPISDLEAVAAYQMTGQDVGWLLRHWAEKKPDHPFLIWEPRDGRDRTWTYSQFLAEARAIGAGLARRGVGKGDRVMIHADNCPEMVLAWYGCAPARRRRGHDQHEERGAGGRVLRGARDSASPRSRSRSTPSSWPRTRST
jgi:hypothetical protein